VYLDDVAALFVRKGAENADIIQRLGIDCATAPIAPRGAASGDSFRARAERFSFLMNAASIYFLLSRDSDANTALAQAEQLFPDNSNLHLVKAQMFAATNRRDEAEREYLRVLSDRPSDAAWFALARLYSSEHRYPEALRCVKAAAPLSLVPYERLRAMGLLYLYMNRPQEAVAAFDTAERTSPYHSESSDLGKQFDAKLAEGKASAYRQLNDLDRAAAQQKLATSLTPDDPASWTGLADIYDAQGRSADSSQARQHAESIVNAGKESAKSIE
jgi:tetratricopeptide (TPR) repeat protein